jgi:hypothetical protein
MSDSQDLTESGTNQQIIDRQYRVARKLNDELFRIIRIHLLLGGGLATVLSILTSISGSSVFFADRSEGGYFILWSIFIIISVWSGTVWILRLSSVRIPYSELSMLTGQIKYSPERESFLDELKSLYIGSINRKDLSTPDTKQISLSPATSDLISENREMLLRSEKYVNTVQIQLFISFLFLVLGICGVILI